MRYNKGPNAPEIKRPHYIPDGGPDETEVICSKCRYPYFTAIYDECPRCKKCKYCGLIRYDKDTPPDGPPSCCKEAYENWKKERDKFIRTLNGEF